MSAFFSKAASNECRIPEHSLYLNNDVTPKKPGGPIDHRQPAETCVSHIMRPIHFYISKSYYITSNTKHISKLVRSNIYTK